MSFHGIDIFLLKLAQNFYHC